MIIGDIWWYNGGIGLYTCDIRFYLGGNGLYNGGIGWYNSGIICLHWKGL